MRKIIKTTLVALAAMAARATRVVLMILRMGESFSAKPHCPRAPDARARLNGR